MRIQTKMNYLCTFKVMTCKNYHIPIAFVASFCYLNSNNIILTLRLSADEDTVRKMWLEFNTSLIILLLCRQTRLDLITSEIWLKWFNRLYIEISHQWFCTIRYNFHEDCLHIGTRYVNSLSKSYTKI